MIWNSIPLMTAIDLLIIAVTVCAIWRMSADWPQQTTLGAANRPSLDRLGTGGCLSVLFCGSRVKCTSCPPLCRCKKHGVHGMRELQLMWRELGSEKPFQLRIGVNTGFCTVGNFGSEDRMDYTIIGNEVNLAARLQSHAELGGILVAHETSCLIKDTILTEEQEAVSVKGFAQPVRAYRVVGIYDELEKDGRVIREERDGFRLLVDLSKGDQASAIAAVENVLARLKG